MVDHNKYRAKIFQAAKNYLIERGMRIDQGKEPQRWDEFAMKLKVSYGVTNGLLNEVRETLLPGSQIVDGELVQKE